MGVPRSGHARQRSRRARGAVRGVGGAEIPRPAADPPDPGALRRHWPVALVLVAGAALRLAVVLAYDPVFWFPDTPGYLRGAETVQPEPRHPWGYSGFLWVLLNVGLGLRGIAVVQHLLTLALGGALYALLARHGVRPWLAAAALVPLTLSPLVLNVEHHVLSDPLFIALVAGAAVLLTWSHARPAPWMCVAAGALLAWAALTRQVGLAAIPLAAAYLLARRVGVVRLGAFALAAALPLGGYLVWMDRTHGVYAFTTTSDRHLYARVAPIAECERLGTLTPEERKLCDPRPPEERPGPEGYRFGRDSPAYDVPTEVQRRFARKVIVHQSLDYLALVGGQSLQVFHPGRSQREGEPCVASWDFPGQFPGGCRKDAVGTFAWKRRPVEVNVPLATALGAYQQLDYPIGPVFLACLLLTLAAIVWRPRERPWRTRLDAALLVGLGLGLTVAAIATANFSYRYTMPLYPLLAPGAALALTHLLALRRPEGDARGQAA